MLVSATLTPAVLATCSQWCPDLRPVVVGSEVGSEAGSQTGSEPLGGAAEGPAADMAQPGSPVAPQAPQWGWDADSRQPERERLSPHASNLAHHQTHCSQSVSSGSGQARFRVAPSKAIPYQHSSLRALQTGEQIKQASSAEAGAALPPNISHMRVVAAPHRRVDALRRCIHALDAQRCLVFMNFQQRLKVIGLAHHGGIFTGTYIYVDIRMKPSPKFAVRLEAQMLRVSAAN